MEEEKVLVLDASVAVKWFSAEQLRDKAYLILRKHIDGEAELIAPSILYYEVANP